MPLRRQHFPPPCDSWLTGSCPLSWSCWKQWESSLLRSTTSWSGRKSRQSRAAQSHSSSLGDHSRAALYKTVSISQYLSHFKINSLWILESLQDPSVEMVAAEDEVWVPVSWRSGARRSGWTLIILKHTFQQGELYQVQQPVQGLLSPHLIHNWKNRKKKNHSGLTLVWQPTLTEITAGEK